MSTIEPVHRKKIEILKSVDVPREHIIALISIRHRIDISFLTGYVDGVDGVGGLGEYEEVGNDTIKRQKELIAIVKANQPLWDKRQKGYSGKNFNKELAWASVAEMLGNMSGLDAENEFYKIRQKYGKERRKVFMSLKGKSGQSAQPTYVSTWKLYEICDSFLRAVILPRKTSSNYMKQHSPAQFQLVVPQIVKPSIAHHNITAAQTPSANWTPDLSASLSSDDTCESVISESPKISFQSARQQQVQTQPQSQTQSLSTVEIGAPMKEENTAQQVLQTMSLATAKRVPPPDTFSKRKRKSDDEFTEAYIKQSEGLNNLALQVSQTLLAKNNPEPAHATAPDPIEGAIHLALTKVKDADKFECMCDVLQFINDKYVKNKK